VKAVVLTGNQPRHAKFVEVIAGLASEVCVFSETTAIRSGHVSDFYSADVYLARYFDHVRHAEREIFGDTRFMPRHVQVLPLRMRDLRDVSQVFQSTVEDADIVVSFGSSVIKQELLLSIRGRPTLNVHAGISPYYRGTACNFWALYDNNPHLVGVTIHALDAGIDSGPIYRRLRPEMNAELTPFMYTMLAVRCGINSLIDVVPRVLSNDLVAVPQEGGRLIRYSRNQDFTSDIARTFLERIDEQDFRLEDPLPQSGLSTRCKVLPTDF
jgi:hypothetical protein